MPVNVTVAVTRVNIPRPGTPIFTTVLVTGGRTLTSPLVSCHSCELIRKSHLGLYAVIPCAVKY